MQGNAELKGFLKGGKGPIACDEGITHDCQFPIVVEMVSVWSGAVQGSGESGAGWQGTASGLQPQQVRQVHMLMQQSPNIHSLVLQQKRKRKM